ncbi:DUF1810 domain-containing protein [Aurantimonas sp. A2-1-M11]|uniref:DUF1810 domain-containing protein n=1 Tax=Aurantimonas sp. A2-1-M11 TaxID=3113712 RepID=UPI002F92CDB3
MTSDDPFDLHRFVDAQAPVFDQALDELRAGAKRTHWMWFVFPQLRGLGRSDMAQHYGMTGLDEARAYLDHPLLGPRLAACTEAVMAHADRSLAAIFGAPDDMKFVSSMTLFAQAADGTPALYCDAIAQFCGGREDAATLRLLQTSG